MILTVGSLSRRLALLASVAIFAHGGSDDAPRLTFSKSFPGSVPPYFAITLAPDGAATYNESEDPDNSEALHLEPAATRQAFELAERLDRFKKPLESGLKIANMGQKTLRWEQGSEKSEAKYNYSTMEDAKAYGRSPSMTATRK